MDAQEIFDKVVAHLAKQGHRAIGTGGSCMYLAPNGDMCAVGCLLGDAYVFDMEAQLVSELVSIYGLPFENHINMLTALQYAHDHPLAVLGLVERLQTIATTYQLEFDRTVITSWQ